jgi:hypothetical protein
LVEVLGGNQFVLLIQNESHDAKQSGHTDVLYPNILLPRLATNNCDRLGSLKAQVMEYTAMVG